MENFKVKFDKLEWESIVKGARFKVFRQDNKQIRLVEFSQGFVEKDWCLKSHIGFVLEGKIEIDFNGKLFDYASGDAIFIAKGENNAHKVRLLTPLVKLFLVEDV